MSTSGRTAGDASPSANGSIKGPVTIVTQTRVRPESVRNFARWQEETSRTVAQFPGFIKQTVMPPSPPAQADWVILQRFASTETAVAWLNSEQRLKRIQGAADMLVGRDDVGAQTRQIFENIAAVLAEAGATLKDVVKITTFIVPMERYGEFSAVRAEVFEGQYPASATVGVASLVSPDYLIEIEAIAAVEVG